ncbi:hypothetical protein PR068_00875 [Metamycoplasma hyosynoviae]|uniref:hypothetical protein n=1 Tax=Metamycoplasma hyosynoviae TaxID=29559 RepID=UPI002358794C|nr:hypothetical protein [Metamycoplasma hyosynoviae]MDC8920894.1 hypothetical protein [Metamycoplasma hyosynoviae]
MNNKIKKEKHNILIPIATTLVGLSVPSVLSVACKNNTDIKIEKPEMFQKPIKGDVKYIALGDQYSRNHNDSMADYFDASSSTVYGLSYPSYIANYIKLLSNNDTKLKSYYNFSLSKSDIDTWLYLLSSNTKPTANVSKILAFNKNIDQHIQIQQESKIKKYFNDFDNPNSSSSFFINQVQNANLLTLSLGINDFVEYEELAGVIWKLVYSNFTTEQADAFFEKEFTKFFANEKQVVEKYNALITKIRELNKNVNINIVGYVQPFVKFSKILENKYQTNYIAKITNKVNSILETVSKAHRLNYLDFSTTEFLEKNLNSVSLGLTDDTLNTKGIKKVSQDIFIKMSLSYDEYEILINQKDAKDIKPEEQLKLSFARAIDFGKKGSFIKNNVVGIGVGQEISNKEFDFERHNNNQKIIQYEQDVRHNSKYISQFTAYFNGGKNFSNEDILKLINYLFSLTGIYLDDLPNFKEYIKKNLDDTKKKEILIKFLLEMVSNEELKNSVHLINDEIEKLFLNNHIKNVSPEKVFQTIYENLKWDQIVFNALKELVKKDIFKDPEVKTWISDVFKLILKDFLNSETFTGKLGQFAPLFNNLKKNPEFQNKLDSFITSTIDFVLKDTNIIFESKDIIELIIKLMNNAEDSFKALVNHLLLEISKDKKLVEDLTNSFITVVAKKYEIPSDVIENIKYSVNAILTNFHAYEDNYKFIKLFIKSYLQVFNTKTIDFNLLLTSKIFDNLLLVSSEENGINILISILGYMPANPRIEKEKYLKGIKDLILHYLKKEVKLLKFVDATSRNLVLNLLFNYVNNPNINAQAKDIIKFIVEQALDDILSNKSLFYEMLKNISEWSIIRPLINMVEKNGLKDKILALNPGHNSVEDLANKIFKILYEQITSTDMVSTFKETILHVIYNQTSYKSKSILQFVSKMVENSEANSLNKIVNMLFEKISSTTELWTILNSFITSFVETELKISMTEEEKQTLQKYVADFWKNIPKSKLYANFYKKIVDTAKKVNIDDTDEEISKLYITELKNFISIIQNLTLVSDIFDLIFIKDKSSHSEYDFKKVLKIYGKFLSSEQFVKYIFEKTQIKQLLLKLVANIEISDPALKEIITDFQKQLKEFIETNWEAKIENKIRDILTKSFSDSVIQSSDTFAKFVSNALTTANDNIKDIIKFIFDEFIFKSGTDNAKKLGQLLVEIIDKEVKGFEIKSQYKTSLASIIEKILVFIKDNDLYTKISDSVINGLKENIEANGFDFSKFDSTKIFKEDLLKEIFNVKFKSLIEDKLTNQEISDLIAVLFDNIDPIIEYAFSGTSSGIWSKIFKPNYVFDIIKVIYNKLTEQQRKDTVEKLFNHLDKIAKIPVVREYIETTIKSSLDKLDSNVQTIYKKHNKEFNTTKLSKELTDVIFNVLLTESNLTNLKEIFSHMLNFSPLYPNSNLEEFIIKVLKNAKTNGFEKLVSNNIDALTKQSNLIEFLSNLSLSLLDNEFEINFTKQEFDDLKNYLTLLFTNLNSFDFFKETYAELFTFLANNDTTSFDTLKSKLLSELTRILTPERLEKLVDLIILNKPGIEFSAKKFIKTIKPIFAKGKLIDKLFEKYDLKKQILDAIKKIKLDSSYTQNVQNEFAKILKNLANVLETKWDSNIKPLLKTIIENAFKQENVKDIDSIYKWISKILVFSSANIETNLDEIFKELLKTENLLDAISSFLVELADQNLGTIDWQGASNGKETLKQSIKKLLKVLPEINLIKPLAHSLIKSLELNISTFHFNYKKYEIAAGLDILYIINNLNYDKINEWVKTLTSEEIRNITIMLLNNLSKFSNLISNTSNSSTISNNSNETLNVGADKFYEILKSFISLLKTEDRQAIKTALPKLYDWIKSDEKVKKFIKDKLSIITKKLVELDPSYKELADKSIEKIEKIIYGDKFKALFNKLLETFIGLESTKFNELNTLNKVFQHLLSENKNEIKEVVKEALEAVTKDNDYVDKLLSVAFTLFEKKYKISSTSNQVNNIKSIIKRLITKINSLNFVSKLTDDFIDNLTKTEFINNNKFDLTFFIEQLVETMKKVKIDEYITSDNIKQLIETIFDKNIIADKLENEIYDLYTYIKQAIVKIKESQQEQSSNQNQSIQGSQPSQEEWLKKVEKLIFNLMSGINGAIASDNQNGKTALINVIYRIIKNEIDSIDYVNLTQDIIKPEKLKLILNKVINYEEIKALITSFVNDFIGGEKLEAKNFGELLSKIIDKIKPNLTDNLTKIANKFAQDDELLNEVLGELINFLKLENVTDEDKSFLKDLTSKLLVEFIKTDLYKKKLLNRTLTQFSNYAKEFDINKPQKWINDAIEKIKSAFSMTDALFIANYIGEDKIINGEKLVKLINLLLGKSKNPDSIIFNALRSLNQDPDENKRTNLASLNKIISEQISFKPKPIGDPNDPDNITVSIDPLTTINTIFKLLAQEVNKESQRISGYNDHYKIRSKQEAYKATYRLLVTTKLALFEMFGRETKTSDRDRSTGITSVTLYKGTRAILWEIQEGTNLKAIPFISSKFSGMQRYFTNEKIRREFTNYCIEEHSSWFGLHKTWTYYEEDNYTPDAIAYIITSSGYHSSENHLLKPFKYKVTEDGTSNSISKKEYILLTIKEGGFGKFMKLNNTKSLSKWSGLHSTTEWE